MDGIKHRILGSPFKSPSKESLECPICNEGMISLNQLNQHIDDIHEKPDIHGTEARTRLQTQNEHTPVNDAKDNENTTRDSNTENANREDIENANRGHTENDTKDREHTNGNNAVHENHASDQGKQASTVQGKPGDTNKTTKTNNNSGFNKSGSSNAHTGISKGDKDNIARTPVKIQKSHPFTPPTQKNLSVDLHETNAFTLSPSRGTSPKKMPSRRHWKHPSTSSTCMAPGCTKSLDVRNGIVNCRKCGNLFCNTHTDNRVRLTQGPKLPEYCSSGEGVWARCCDKCYWNKPDLIAGTVVNSREITGLFSTMRRAKNEERQLQRNNIVKRFINLSEKKSTWYDMFGNTASSEWDNRDNCTVCYTAFGILLRRHHCRLCGSSVCDDPYGERKHCSIMVPISKFVEKLPDLNYPVPYKDAVENSTTFRCCVKCKNLLLYDYKKQAHSSDSEVFNAYSALMAIKRQVELLVEKYEQLAQKLDHPDLLITCSKHRARLVNSMKDYEKHVLIFKSRFFEPDKMVAKKEYASDTQMLLNMYQGQIMALQDNLEKYKTIDAVYQEKMAPKKEPPKEQTLSKKAIRELREQLMVMNEQRFLVEKLMEEKIKARKFEELRTLGENKTELDGMIEELEAKLGGFAF